MPDRETPSEPPVSSPAPTGNGADGDADGGPARPPERISGSGPVPQPQPSPATIATSGPLAGARAEVKRRLDAVYRRFHDTGIDFFQSAMHTDYGWLLRWASWRFFRHARVDPAEVARIKEAAAKGEVVYVMRHRSLLDYLYFNYLFVREGLPLASFGNEINLLLFLPFGRAMRTMFAKAAWFLRHGWLPDPIDSGWLEQLISQQVPFLVFLKRRQTFLDYVRRNKPRRDVAEALIEGARQSERPVFLVPTVVLWERRPKTGKKTPVDVVFGEADKPRRLRKIVSFLRNYEDGLVSFGEPLELKEFLALRHERSERRAAGSGLAEATEVTAKKLRWVMLQHLWRERRVVTGSRVMPVAQIAKKIQNDPDVRAEVERLAAREGKPIEVVRRRVDRMVVKIAADLRWNWLMLFERVLTWVFNNIYDGVTVDAQGARMLKRLVKDDPVVLVPSHKSHADYMILSYVLFHQDMQVPIVAAGDNLSFFPMGYVFRRMGAFFIRRSFRGDVLYALVLERYIRNMIKAGHTVEFFIEGGRSRTGRVLRPKLGILTMVVRSWESGASEDVWLSPISINYEKVIEEKSYIRELEGGKKEKESARSLLKVLGVLKKRYGRVFVEFAEPISLKTSFGCDGPAFAAKPEAERRAAIKALGDHLANGINGVTVVTPSQVVAAALLAHGKRGMMHSSLVETATFLLDFVKAAGVRHSPILGPDPSRGFELALQGFLAEKVISRGEEDDEPWYVIDDDQRVSLDFYKNMVLHFFAPASFVCAELAIRASMPRERLVAAFRATRERLRLEFPDVEPEEQDLELEVTLSALAAASVIAPATGTTVELHPDGRRRMRWLASLSHSLFEAYYAAARSLAGAEPSTEKDLAKRIESAATKTYRNGVLERKESLARPVLANALKQLLSAGALVRDPADAGKLVVDEAKRRGEEAFWARFLRL